MQFYMLVHLQMHMNSKNLCRCELRIMAHFSQDPALLTLLRKYKQAHTPLSLTHTHAAIHTHIGMHGHTLYTVQQRNTMMCYTTYNCIMCNTLFIQCVFSPLDMYQHIRLYILTYIRSADGDSCPYTGIAARIQNKASVSFLICSTRKMLQVPIILHIKFLSICSMCLL